MAMVQPQIQNGTDHSFIMEDIDPSGKIYIVIDNILLMAVNQTITEQPKRGRLWFNDGSCIRLRPDHSDLTPSLVSPSIRILSLH
jgi:hypothetical protein